MRNFLHLIAAYGLLTAGLMSSAWADDHEMDTGEVTPEAEMTDVADAAANEASMAASEDAAAAAAAAGEAGQDVSSGDAADSGCRQRSSQCRDGKRQCESQKSTSIGLWPQWRTAMFTQQQCADRRS